MENTCCPCNGGAHEDMSCSTVTRTETKTPHPITAPISALGTCVCKDSISFDVEMNSKG